MENMNLIKLYDKYIESDILLNKMDRISANMHIDNISAFQGNGGYHTEMISYLAKEALDNKKEEFLKDIHDEMIKIVKYRINKIKG